MYDVLTKYIYHIQEYTNFVKGKTDPRCNPIALHWLIYNFEKSWPNLIHILIMLRHSETVDYFDKRYHGIAGLAANGTTCIAKIFA